MEHPPCHLAATPHPTAEPDAVRELLEALADSIRTNLEHTEPEPFASLPHEATPEQRELHYTGRVLVDLLHAAAYLSGGLANEPLRPTLLAHGRFVLANSPFLAYATTTPTTQERHRP
ncbi:hypothetical protein [Streptomyces noursei]